ncbi:polysaccharide pyruvyl transferase family protein [Nakamurella silvestris]|nr:polysaccharide pyruvyl transferase family protein [Nakamurella silvestris]
MTIDIRGTNTINKGAQLMLEATVERLSLHFKLSTPPIGSDYAIRAKLGLYQTMHDFKAPVALTKLGNLTPGFARRRFGIVPDSEITGVVDASGFAYSDSFGTARISREARYGISWRKRGIPKVMLPQAFGPFQNADSLKWYRMILEQADLVFVRDAVSAKYLADLGVTTRIEGCCDFTIGLSVPEIPRVVEGPFAAIVPNYKMISQAGLTPAGYRQLLRGYVDSVRAAGLAAVLVIHERGDLDVCDELVASGDVEVFSSEHPRVLKAALGQAELTIASRFHAVVGSLSQGVPTLALGWSHKYLELLRDFAVDGWIATGEDAPADRVADVLGDLSGRQRLLDTKPQLVAKVDRMWDETIEVLRG